MKTSQIFLFAIMSCISAFNFYGQHFVNDPIEIRRGSNGQSSFITNNHNPFIWSTQNAALPYPFGDVDLGHLVIQSRTSSPRDILFITGNGDDIRMSIKGDGNVGIGTNSPVSKLEVNGTFRAQDVITVQTGGAYKVALNGQSDGYIAGRDNSFTQKFLIRANGNSWFNGGNVGIGTTDPGIYKLAVNGNLRAKEVKVETGWSDFVFEKDYDLPTLEEVEEHIQDKGHLQDIPSAKEVAENGILLGEMDSKLLQKIEELTLYTIAQEKRIKHLEKENKTLKSITKRMEKIEALLKTK